MSVGGVFGVQQAGPAFASDLQAKAKNPVSGIVGSIAKAPIVPDGDVDGALADLVIDLESSLDPSMPGRSLRQGDRDVGQVFISTPERASGQEIFAAGPSFQIPAPVSGRPTARLTAFFRAGSAPGDCVVTFALNGGNSVQMFVQAG